MTSNIKIACIIPSRLGSTRLPNKALLPINGVPMVARVMQQAKKCALFNKVLVATDSSKIADTVLEYGGEAIMTDPELATGTDRVASVAAQLEGFQVIVNLQGDEPFMQPSMLEALVSPYLNGENPEMSTLAHTLKPEDHARPEVVKVITDRSGYALYFSRSPIPYLRTDNRTLEQLPVYHHMGIYAFRADFLQHFTRLAMGDLELAESLEQLRALENGFKIKVQLVKTSTLEINTPQDYELAKNFKPEMDI